MGSSMSGLTTEDVRILDDIMSKHKTARSQKRRDAAIENMPNSMIKVMGMGGVLWQMAPWIAIGMVLIIFVVLMSIMTAKAVKSGSAANNIRSAKNAVSSGPGKLLNSIKYYWQQTISLASANPRTRMMMKRLNPFGGEPQTVIRSEMSAGRCDNLNFFESTGNKCFVSKKPADHEWTIDTTQLRDYSSLPGEIQQNLENKMKVKIPYTASDTFYVPQCTQAHFVNAAGEKTGDASYLLEDYGMSCRKRELNSKVYNSVAGNTITYV